MAVILILTAAISVDFLDQSDNTLMLASARNIASAQLSEKALSDPACLYSSVQSTILDSDGSITLVIKGCDISAAAIADEIEESLCKYAPDGNDKITCGSVTRDLKVVKV